MRLDYPLRLRPVLKQYLWGGRRLGELLDKELADGDTYAESWEVVDHPDGQSVVENGPLAGKTLGELGREAAADLYGDGEAPPRFPLLLKFLDAQKTLSVQVHPNDAQGAELTPPDLGKTEAWLVVAAESGAKIYAGLAEGVGRDELAAALEGGEVDRCLHAFEPEPGDCVFIPAGTVHALGAGLVIAEIQQASNTTFRLFDWNRVDRDGEPRPLHVEQSLAVTDYTRGPVGPQTPKPIADGWERLVACDKFRFDRREMGPGDRASLPEASGFRIVSVVSGSATLEGEGFAEPLSAGQTLLLPAACPPATIAATAPVIALHMSGP
ncbi:MAG: type I phosphomannose isomerase catalytic subunit [Planctomycetota bacterium]